MNHIYFEYASLMTVYCFDLDGTLCRTDGSNYEQSTPIIERIQVVNKLYEEGHQIIIFTARGSLTGIDWTEVTNGQLYSWGIRHHRLLLGKPTADIYIDDKGIKDSDFFDTMIK